VVYDDDTWDVEEVQAVARAIHGHPTITSFDSGYNLPYEWMGSLYSALATLPALESISLSISGQQARPQDESTLANYESLTELLRLPSMRPSIFIVSLSQPLFVKQQRTHSWKAPRLRT
jgi:hypothetical protein